MAQFIHKDICITIIIFFEAKWMSKMTSRYEKRTYEET